MSEVLIEIKGTQQYPDGEPDVTTFTTTGTAETTGDKLVLRYNESEMIGADNVSTKIEISEDMAVLTRSGGMESQLTIEKGRRHTCLYNTPQGDFVIGIFGAIAIHQHAIVIEPIQQSGAELLDCKIIKHSFYCAMYPKMHSWSPFKKHSFTSIYFVWK